MASRDRSERAPTVLAPGRVPLFGETFEVDEPLAGEYGQRESLAALRWWACRLQRGHWPQRGGRVRSTRVKAAAGST